VCECVLPVQTEVAAAATVMVVETTADAGMIIRERNIMASVVDMRCARFYALSSPTNVWSAAKFVHDSRWYLAVGTQQGVVLLSEQQQASPGATSIGARGAVEPVRLALLPTDGSVEVVAVAAFNRIRDGVPILAVTVVSTFAAPSAMGAVNSVSAAQSGSVGASGSSNATANGSATTAARLLIYGAACAPGDSLDRWRDPAFCQQIDLGFVPFVLKHTDISHSSLIAAGAAGAASQSQSAASNSVSASAAAAMRPTAGSASGAQEPSAITTAAVSHAQAVQSASALGRDMLLLAGSDRSVHVYRQVDERGTFAVIPHSRVGHPFPELRSLPSSILTLDVRYLPRSRTRVLCAGCQNGFVVFASTDLNFPRAEAQIETHHVDGPVSSVSLFGPTLQASIATSLALEPRAEANPVGALHERAMRQLLQASNANDSEQRQQRRQTRNAAALPLAPDAVPAVDSFVASTLAQSQIQSEEVHLMVTGTTGHGMWLHRVENHAAAATAAATTPAAAGDVAVRARSWDDEYWLPASDEFDAVLCARAIMVPSLSSAAATTTATATVIGHHDSSGPSLSNESVADRGVAPRSAPEPILVLGTYAQQLLFYAASSDDVPEVSPACRDADDLQPRISFDLAHTRTFAHPVHAIECMDFLGDGGDELVVVSMYGVTVLQFDLERARRRLVETLYLLEEIKTLEQARSSLLLAAGQAQGNKAGAVQAAASASAGRTPIAPAHI
jgi:hypothetical protein